MHQRTGEPPEDNGGNGNWKAPSLCDGWDGLHADGDGDENGGEFVEHARRCSSWIRYHCHIGMIAQQASVPFGDDDDGDAWSSVCMFVAGTPARARALALNALGENECDVPAGAAKSTALK